MQKKVLNSPRLAGLKEKRQQVRRKKYIYFFFLIVLVLIIFSFLLRWDKLNIQSIEISGTKVLAKSLIENNIKKNLSGNYLFFIPRTNFLFYPKNNIETELKSEFSRVKKVNLNNRSLNTLKVEIQEYEGKYLWCGQIKPILVTEEQNCFFVDDEGYIFDKAPYFSGEVYVKFYGALSGDNILGSYFLKDKFIDLMNFNHALELIGIKPTYFSKNEEGDIYVGLTTKGMSTSSPEIIFKADADFIKIADNIDTVFNTEPLKNILREKYASILYVDLRFGNKVYYKLR